MKTTHQILNSIASLPPGEVFAFSELQLPPEKSSAGVKALGRMVESGFLRRASTGKYYKPDVTPFGELKPAEETLLRTYLFQNGRRIAYITGPSLYNQLGLTTQVTK